MMTFEKIAMRDAFAQAAIEALEEGTDLVVLDTDVSKSTKSTVFGKAHPERFLNVGIAEANMLGIAAGLASTGMVPVVNSFAMLLTLRSLDQFRQSIAYPRLNVKVMGHYAGYSAGPEGPSHHAIEDIGIMRSIPNVTVLVPCDAAEAYQAFKAAVQFDGPVYLRLARNPVPALPNHRDRFVIGQGYELRDGADLTIIGTGVMVARALEAADRLTASGVSARVVAMPSIKPLDAAIVEQAARETGGIVTAEEHNIYGGLGSAVAEVLGESIPVPLQRVGIRDCYAESGEWFELLDHYGLTVEAIGAAALQVMERKDGGEAKR